LAQLYYWRAIRCGPQAWQPYFNLARLFAIEARHAAARPLLERAILLRPGAFAPAWLLAQVCEQQDDCAEALFWLRRAKALHPTEPNVEVALARLAATPAEELIHLDAAVQSGCRSDEVLFNLGLCHLREGRTNDARAIWEKSSTPEASHALATLALTDGDRQLAGGLLDRYPNDELLALLAEACSDSGDRLQAIEYYRRAVTHCPGSADAWFNLGIELTAAGESAVNEWQTALRLDPQLCAEYFESPLTRAISSHGSSPGTD
jgi:tetratricopeptide (TPR) repeat protein